MNIAIITARGGSKRIPRKNIKDFLGKPLISYSIEAAISSGIFDEVMVSTDDREIADIAMSFGAKVPFFRSEKTSDDFATTVDVIAEVLEKYKSLERNFSNFCCIYPTAPFLTDYKLKNSLILFESSEGDTLFSMCRFGYPIQRSFQAKGSFVEMIWPENYPKRSQDLEPCFHDAGQFYWGKVDIFLERLTLFGEKTVGFELSELEVQDIDNPVDWDIAELKYQRVFSQK